MEITEQFEVWFGLVWYYGSSTIFRYQCQIRFYTYNQFYFEQFSLAYVQSLVLFDPQIGFGSDGNERLLHILQSSSITATSLSDYLVSYPVHSLEESYPSAEMQSVYFAVPADWAIVEQTWSFNLDMVTHPRERKHWIQTY